MYQSEYKVRISEFFKKHRSMIKPVLIALLGVLLLLLAAGGSTDKATDEDALTRQVREFLEEIDGVGECRVIISYEYKESGYFSSGENARVKAVAVACRGAKRVEVRKRITDVLCTVFDIGANRVSVSELD